MESVGGVLLILTPEPTLVTKVGGSILAVHGADVMQAAVRQLFSGQRVADYTQTGAIWAAQRGGASNTAAHRIGVILDVAVPFATGAAMDVTAKIGSIRAGRVVITSEEAVAGKPGRISFREEEADPSIGKEGGHTLEKHVGVSNSYLEQRAVDSQDARAVFSRFTSKKVGEAIVNDAVRSHSAAIQKWALRARPGSVIKLDLPANGIIGDGFSNVNGKYVTLSTVRISLRMSYTPGKTFYLFSAFPK